jgi:hypothetical protein
MLAGTCALPTLFLRKCPFYGHSQTLRAKTKEITGMNTIAAIQEYQEGMS